MTSGIYRIKNSVNGKIYIGSAADLYNRFMCHKSQLRRGVHVNKKLQNAWNKYGESNFLFENVLICSKDNLLIYEQKIIDFYDVFKTGYNMSPTAGNTLGRKHSEAARLKMSKTRKGISRKPLTEEHRKNISLSQIGKIVSKECREKIRKSLTGKKLSDETKRKMSITRSGINYRKYWGKSDLRNKTGNI